MKLNPKLGKVGRASRPRKPAVTSDPENTLVLADSLLLARLGVRYVEAGHAYGIAWFDEQPNGATIVRFAVGPGYEHRLPEIEAIITRAAGEIGALKIDVGDLGRLVATRGKA